ncbi:MAG: hypothetical protein ACRC0G_15775, partial [Fusobacteriaceae bacterium]
ASKEISFKISFESDLTIVEDQIKDILFVKKSQDISIDKSDIIEIYQFIGNPESHLTNTPEKKSSSGGFKAIDDSAVV